MSTYIQMLADIDALLKRLDERLEIIKEQSIKDGCENYLYRMDSNGTSIVDPILIAKAHAYMAKATIMAIIQ